MKDRYNLLARSIKQLPLVFLLLVSTAFAAETQSSAVAQAPQLNSALITQLQSAKSADWDAALDPTVSPVRQETFLNQMNKADRAIKELSHGFPVSQSEINDALWMPPRHMTPAERAQLIEQLQQARDQDDRNEQSMLNGLAWARSSAPADTAVFDESKARADRVIEDLKIGVPVHWSDIHQALVVPKSPY